MKRIFAGVICCILALLMLLSLFTGFFINGQAATKPTVKVVLSSLTSAVSQGISLVVKVRLELTGFTTTDGIYSFSSLPVEYNQSLFEYSSSSTLGTTDEDKVTISPSTSNKVIIKFSTKDKPIEKSRDIANITFKAKTTSALGTGSFNVGTASFLDSVEVPYLQLASSALNIEVSDRASSNNFLSTLSLQEANIKPTFKKDVYSYTASVDYNVTKVNPVYTTEDTLLTDNVKFTGNNYLKIGDNIVSIIVTAADGTTKTYKITVNRSQSVTGGNGSVVVPTNDKVTGSDLEKAKLEGEQNALATFKNDLEREKNRNFLIDMFLVFVILCELIYIVLLRYGNVIFKGKRTKTMIRK